MRQFVDVSALGLVCGLALAAAACGAEGPSSPDASDRTDGPGGAAGQGGSGGGAGGGSGGQGGSGGGPGGGGQSGSGGATDAGPGGGGVGGAARDARAPDAASSTGDGGGLAALDAFCTPRVILMVPADHPGGQKFMMALGGTSEAVTATVQQMGREICRYLYRSADEVRPANEMELIVDPMYTGIAAKSGNIGKVRVRFGANYVANYTGDVVREVKGILYHEMTHIYQNDDKPEGLGAGGWPGLANYYESHADAVRTHMGFTSCGAPNKTGTWDRGPYCARAHWWLWLENAYPDFLYKLNLQMKGGDNMIWTPARGATIVNKTFEELWTEYQAAACCAGTNRTCCQ
jgi:hypothetical protein